MYVSTYIHTKRGNASDRMSRRVLYLGECGRGGCAGREAVCLARLSRRDVARWRGGGGNRMAWDDGGGDESVVVKVCLGRRRGEVVLQRI